jgi:hypothetical protein
MITLNILPACRHCRVSVFCEVTFIAKAFSRNRNSRMQPQGLLQEEGEILIVTLKIRVSVDYVFIHIVT